ncbi:MAG: Na+/H+ antiporter NhaC family protein, partial [Phycisphaerae bacterium]
WVGAEIGYIDAGLNAIPVRPDFLANMSSFDAFVFSIPFRYYAILALVMVVLVGWLNRDFGPMRKSERNAPPPNDATESFGSASEQPLGRAWYAAVPVLVLVVVTLFVLVMTGLPAGGIASIQAPPDTPHWLGVIQQVLKDCSANTALLYGALAAVFIAIAITMLTRAISLARTVDGATEAMQRMFPAIVVLVLAWSLSAGMADLQLGQVAKTLLEEAQFNPIWLPLLIFVSSCVVSFATGTSWGTMGILCPAAVTIAAGLLADYPPDQALPIFYAAVGSVLAGSVFGDHCTLISDTTVLSSIASDCPLTEHVWTQLPYALVTAGVSILCGEIFCRYYNLSPWIGLLAGAALLWLILMIFGRKPPAVSVTV